MRKKIRGVLRKVEYHNCEYCGEKFTREIRKNNSKRFCNKECKLKYIKTGKYVKCNYCNKKIYRQLNEINKSKNGIFYCSRKCQDKSKTINGINNYRKRAFSKFNEKCCDCGESRKYLLLVHHIDGNRENNILNNLEILCGNCHIKRHLKLVNGEWVYDSHKLTPRNKLEYL